MNCTDKLRFLALPVLCIFVTLRGNLAAQESKATEESRARKPWTTSRIAGSPDMPLPLSLVPAFPGLSFENPMHVRWQPDLERYVVCELGGKIWSFPHDVDAKGADLVVDLKSALKSFDADRSNGCESVYSIAFDPQFARNRFIYVCMILSSKTGSPLPDGSRISRFKISQESPPRIEIQSELPIITWQAGGHNGCDLAFDNSGCLMISTGDATEPSPPDRLKTGQDISDLLSSILRIDVRGATKEKPYVIPTDNPFLSVPKARGEVWAFGFRNPWRISVDTLTGSLYLGDVGWEKWELVHKVVRGGNYGWSVREGSELIQPDAPVGPAPVLPTRVALPHADAASVTGGFVYRGASLSSVAGQYLFGDWITGRIWSLPLDDTSPHREVASGQLRIIAFAPDRDGEPLVVNHLANTTLYRLVNNANYESELANMRNFPKLLSQTGLFREHANLEPCEGVRPFQINHQQWHDGARADYFLALPGLDKVTVYNTPQPVGAIAMFNSRLHYPSGTVLAKTLSFSGDRSGQPVERGRKVETQILHFDGRLWHGYSYVWNDAQTDAELAPAAGTELILPAPDRPKWRVHSRTECMQCHNPWPETTLAFTPEQLHQPQKGHESPWLQLVREGFVQTLDAQKSSVVPETCVRRALSSSKEDSLELRARSYLHANCAHCHQNGAGTAVYISLLIADDHKALKAIDIPPTKGNFGIQGSMLIAAGDPTRSTLILRMASASTGRMPHIGSREVDFGGVATISQWIRELDKTKSHKVDVQANAREILQSFQKPVSNSVPVSSDVDPQTRDSRLQAALATVIEMARLKSSPNDQTIPMPTDTLSKLAQVPDPVISSLFEAFVPARERQRRLGPDATFAELADIRGDAVAGQALFFDQNRSQCSKCHRVGQRGGQVGPDLAQVGKKLSPAQLFESLVDPSRIVEPKYQSHTLLLGDGKVVTGLLESESTSEITLITAQGEKIKIAVTDIESRKLESQSIMPTGLASQLTAQQASDLLAYLSSLR